MPSEQRDSCFKYQRQHRIYTLDAATHVHVAQAVRNVGGHGSSGQEGYQIWLEINVKDYTTLSEKERAAGQHFIQAVAEHLSNTKQRTAYSNRNRFKKPKKNNHVPRAAGARQRLD